MTPLRRIVFALALGALAAPIVGARGTPDQTVTQRIDVRTTSTDSAAPPVAGLNMGSVQQNGTGLIMGQVVDAGSGQPVPGAVVSIGGAGAPAPAPAGAQQMLSFTSVNGGPPVAMGGNPAGGAGVPRVLADAQGRFAFRNLPKGTFNLQAVKPGYIDGAYGRLRPSGSAQSMDLNDGERVGDVKIRLFRAASISGVVLDDTGEPVVGVSLRAYRRNVVAGRRLLGAAGATAQTDDRGMYRLANLVPGDYIVGLPTTQSSVPAAMTSQMDGALSADLISTLMAGGSGSISIGSGGVPTPDGRFVLQNSGRGATALPPDPNGRVLIYPTLYYPSATVSSQATGITLASGEERGGIDLQLRLVPTLNVMGRLSGPDGVAAGYVLHLVPSETGDMASDPDVATAITDVQGEFAFLAVPPGQYVIQTVRAPRGGGAGPGMVMFAQSGGGGGGMTFTTNMTTASNTPPAVAAVPPAPTLWTATPISLGDSDIKDLAVMLRSGYKVSGRVEFEGTAERPPASRLSTVSVTVDAADGKPRTNVSPGRIDASGQFTTYGLLPGKYFLRAANPPAGWTFKGATLNGIDITDTPFDVEDRDLANIALTFTDQTTEVKGTVRNSGGSGDGSAAVVVFPSDNRSWMNNGVSPRRLRITRSGRTGEYTLGGLPAGEYFIAAFSEEFSSEWQDPQFLDTLSRVATRLTLNTAEKRTQDLVIQNVRPSGGLEGDGGPEGDGGRTCEASSVPLVDPVPLLDADDAQQPPQRDVRPPQTPTQTPARDAAADQATGTGVISGVALLDDGSQTPVRRARVTLRSGEGRAERTAATDDSGRFTIGSLAAGHYTLLVAKPAYLTAYYGSKRPGRGPGVPITLASGQTLAGLTVRVGKGAVIGGTIRDDFGLPIPALRVTITQFQMVNGERTSTNATSAVTDDRGIYRAYGLQPGSYLVAAAPPGVMTGASEVRQLSTSEMQTAMADLRQPATARAATPASPGGGPSAAPPEPVGRQVGYASVYYPGTLNLVEASAVGVAAGQELTNVDIPMRIVPTARVEGTVVGPDGRPFNGAQLMMVPADMGEFTSAASSSVRMMGEGKFVVPNVAPGRYTISARSTGRGGDVMMMGGGMGGGTFVMRAPAPASAGGPPPPPPPSPGMPPTSMWAQANVDVNGENITDVTLALQEGMTVSGKVLFAGKALAPPTDLTKIRLSLDPSGPGTGMMMGMPFAELDSTGGFKFTGVPPGKYMLGSSLPGPGGGAAANWAAKSAVADGRDVLDSSLEVRPGQSIQGLVMTFTDQRTELSGTLMDTTGKPTSGLMILVFSTDRMLWTSAGSRRMRPPVQPSTDGKFKITGLPPGEYYLAALTDVEPGDIGNAAFMDQVAAVAIKITLGEGEKKVQDLKIAG
jgi:hypothetical protein